MADKWPHITQRVSRFVYRLMLLAYPRQHRAMYGKQMAQMFDDLCREAITTNGPLGLVHVWLNTLPDVVCSTSLEHMAAIKERQHMSRKSSVVLAAALLFSVITGYINLNANEVQAPMGCLLVFSFLAGFLQPKGAWRWGVLIGLSIPLSYVIGFAVNYAVVDPPHNALTLVILVIPALVATYGGVLFNWALRSASHPAL